MRTSKHEGCSCRSSHSEFEERVNRAIAAGAARNEQRAADLLQPLMEHGERDMTTLLITLATFTERFGGPWQAPRNTFMGAVVHQAPRSRFGQMPVQQFVSQFTSACHAQEWTTAQGTYQSFLRGGGTAPGAVAALFDAAVTAVWEAMEGRGVLPGTKAHERLVANIKEMTS